MTPLALAIQFTLDAEKGWTPIDGGTMYGVTQAVYDKYRKLKSETLQAVWFISLAEVHDIMQTEYWIPAHCDLMSPQLAICNFDWAYNHGNTGALKTLQGALGLDVDGIWGPETQSAVEAAGDSIVPVYLEARREWYRNDTAQSEYLTGWLNRVNALQDYLARNFPA
jgi:lysozyme family protein